ncbi:LuxR C-terminal-related transcriptional regulator [Pseudomonas borbori]
MTVGSGGVFTARQTSMLSLSQQVMRDQRASECQLLPVMPADSHERLMLVSALNAITSVKTITELKDRTQQVLPLLLPCENFVFASGRSKAHRIFISHMVYADAVTDECLRDIIGRDGMIPPVSIDLIEHTGRPKLTIPDRLEEPVDRVWGDIFMRHGIHNVAWIVLPGLYRNTFTAYFFMNTPTSIAHECKLRMTILAPYLHIALNRALGTKRLRRHDSEKPATQFISILSSREAEIAHWVARGKTNWEIGQILGISDKTVKTHMQNIFSKLQASSRAQIAALFSEE